MWRGVRTAQNPPPRKRRNRLKISRPLRLLSNPPTASPIKVSMMVLDRVKQIFSHISPYQQQHETSPYPGLSYHIGPHSPPLKHITLGQMLGEQVSLNGDSEALVSAWQGIRWTYRELNEKSDA